MAEAVPDINDLVSPEQYQAMQGQQAQPTQIPGQPPSQSVPALSDLVPEDQYYGSGNQAVGAGVEALASGLTLGASKLAETQILGIKPEDIASRAKYNPIKNFALEGVGTGLLAAGTGGLGLGAEAAAGVGAKVLSSALQGAVIGGSNSITNDLAMGDPQVNASKIISNGLLSAVIGGGVGGIGSALIDGFGSQIAGKAPGFIADAASTVSKLAKNPDEVGAMTAELSPLLQQNENEFNVFGPNGLKMKAIEKLMPNELSDKMVGQAQDLLAKGNATIQTMMADPDLYSPFYRSSLNKSLNVLRNTLSEPTEPIEVFQAMNQFKQQLDDLIPHTRFEWQNLDVAKKPAVGLLSDITNDVRQGLQDSDVWGKAGDVQQQINKAFSEYVNPLKNFKAKFGSRLAGNETVIDPGKIQTYLNQTGKAGQAIKQDVLGDFVDAHENFRNQINDVVSKIGGDATVGPPSLDFTKSTLGTPSNGQLWGRRLFKTGIPNLIGRVTGGAIGAGIGSFVGSPVAGAIIGEEALNPIISSAISPEALAGSFKVLGGVANALDKTNLNIANKSRLIFTGLSSQARKVNDDE